MFICTLQTWIYNLAGLQNLLGKITLNIVVCFWKILDVNFLKEILSWDFFQS